jgi:hypothetical protein
VAALSVVVSDLKTAASHYASWRTDGHEHILDKYEETISWIAWNPDAFPRKFGVIQRAVLKQSYYVVYFIQEPSRSLILAVLDGRRHPKEIRGIVSSRKQVVRSK